MDDELKQIIRILKKVFPILLKNPKIMRGCDASQKEIEEIINTNQLSLEVLQHVAGDEFFILYSDEINLTEDEAKEVQEFLFKSAPYFLEELKEEMPYLKS